MSPSKQLVERVGRAIHEAMPVTKMRLYPRWENLSTAIDKRHRRIVIRCAKAAICAVISYQSAHNKHVGWKDAVAVLAARFGRPIQQSQPCRARGRRK